MKIFAFFLVLFAFLLNYSNSNTYAKKVKMTGSSCKVNFATDAAMPGYNYIMPDTTSDTTASPTNPDTLIKS
jgi:hypothetical protein